MWKLDMELLKLPFLLAGKVAEKQLTGQFSITCVVLRLSTEAERIILVEESLLESTLQRRNNIVTVNYT